MKNWLKFFGAFVLIVVVIIAISSAIWGFGVVTAPIVGRGEAHKQIQSAEFRIAAYQMFFNQCGSIQALEGQIDEFTALLKEYPSGSRERNITLMNLSGVKGARHTAIAKYNQDSLKEYTEGQFKDRDLPYQIADTNYPTQGGKTICALR